MKKNFKFLILFAAMIHCCGNVFAGGGGSYYAKVKAVVVKDGNEQTSTETAAGKVYVSASTSTPTDSKWAFPSSEAEGSSSWGGVLDAVKDDPGSMSVTLYAFAKKIRGYKFLGWASTIDASSYSGASDSYYSISQTSTGTSSGNGPLQTVYAHFQSLTVFDVKFMVPTNGTYTIDYDALETNPSLSEGAESITESTYATDNITLTATANDQYSFGGWCKDGSSTPFSYDNPLCTSFKEATIINALFVQPYSVTFKGSDKASVLVKKGDENVTLGDIQTGVTPSTTFSLSYSGLDNEKYEFLGWVAQSSEGQIYYITRDASYNGPINIPNCVVFADIIEKSSTTPIFINGNIRYESLSTACENAGVNDIIALYRSGVVEEDALIPENVTLLIPFNKDHACFTNRPDIHSKNNRNDYRNSFVGQVKPDNPTEDINYDNSDVFRMLTLADGVTLTVNGMLNTSATRSFTVNSGATGNYTGQGIPNVSGDCRIYGKYGCITMEQNSNIVVNNGGKLQCWGRIRGEGSITANAGAEVRECFVYTDHRESNSYYIIANGFNCFPMNQYYIQDIQVPITYNYGSKCVLVTGLFSEKAYGKDSYGDNGYGSSGLYSGETILVGGKTDKSFIVLGEGSSFKKTYSVATDRLIFDFEGNADINYFFLPFSLGNLTSENHVFSLNNNWTFNVNSGKMTINNHISLSAGAELNIADSAEVLVNSGASLYVFDEEDWGEFACRRRIIPLFLPSYERKNGWYEDHNIYPESGNWGNSTYLAIRTHNNITDAIIRVNGKLTVLGGESSLKKISDNDLSTGTGGLYTTTHGAQIISDGEGCIVYSSLPGTKRGIYVLNDAGQYPKSNSPKQAVIKDITPAQLLNADGTYTSSAGYAGATQFVYKHGFWVNEEIPASKINVSSDKVQLDEKSEPIVNSTYSITKGQLLAADEVTIEEGATVEVDHDAFMYVAQTFVINASENNSGNLIGANKVALDSNAVAYFDYTFNTPAMRWNAIAFPWKVDATTGVKVGDKTLILGKDFDVVYYDGDIRAKQGKVDECWRYVEDDIDTSKIANPEILLPGRLYMILFATSQDVVRFAKKANASINNTDLSVANYSGNDEDANWNGIANPTLYHAYLTTGVVEGQVYNSETKSYTQIAFDTTSFPVGKPVFVQAQSEQSVLINKDAPTSAPMRAAVNANTQRAEVEIWHNGVSSDMVKVCTNDDALDTYTIGSDLSKAGVSDKVAQMWVNRYNAKLCKNTIAPIDDVAEYPLTIFTPQNGEYTLSLRSISDEMALYLTQDGEIIADLSEDFTITFEKGNSSKYGLRMVIKKQPGVVTSFDEVKTSKSEMEKVIYRGNLYIIRNNQVYNVAGQLVK